MSLNRFERKKDVGVAVRALASLRRGRDGAGASLVIAGGFDPTVTENVEYLAELQALAAELGVADAVAFRPNVSDADRNRLLQAALCVCYTPENEHFGIVPIEAMYAGAPVVASASGGPLETVVDGETGFLCAHTPAAFAEAMGRFLADDGLSLALGRAAHDHVKRRFGMDAFADELDAAAKAAKAEASLPCQAAALGFVTVFALAVSIAARA